jgi:hypothetical protein
MISANVINQLTENKRLTEGLFYIIICAEFLARYTGQRNNPTSPLHAEMKLYVFQ